MLIMRFGKLMVDETFHVSHPLNILLWSRVVPLTTSPFAGDLQFFVNWQLCEGDTYFLSI